MEARSSVTCALSVSALADVDASHPNPFWPVPIADKINSGGLHLVLTQFTEVSGGLWYDIVGELEDDATLYASADANTRY